MEPEEIIRNQIIDQFTGEKNSDTELKKWLDQSFDNKNNYVELKKIWKAVDYISNINKFDSFKAWEYFNQSIQKYNIRKLRIQKVAYVISGMAASVIIILGLAFFTGQFSDRENQMNLITGFGSRTELILPDGSYVKLNSGSNIEYHYNKIKKIREVNFKGEAFFEVAKSKIPFVIKTSKGMQLKVLGTNFNLCAYSEDPNTQTTLIEGKVELSNNGNDKLVLSPGQIAVFDNKTKRINYLQGEPSHKYAWVNGKIYLDNTSLAEVIIRLERWFDVSISLVPESLGKEIHYTGVLEEKTIIDILEALRELSDINYSYKGKNITIMKK